MLKEVIDNDKNALNYEKETMKRTLIERIKELDADEMVREEDRANCTYLTLRTRFE